MKRNDWKLILGSLAFTYLFYEQKAGLNFLIFALLCSILLYLNKPDNIFKPSVVASFIGTMLSAFFVFSYGTSLPLIGFFISIILLSAFTFDPNSSLLISALHGLLSVLLSIPKIVSDLFNRQRTPGEKSKKITKFFLLLIPLFITGIFFFLYRIANPNFLAFTKNLNFDWISLPLLRFFILSLFIMYGLLTRSVIKFLLAKDLTRSDEVSTISQLQHEESAIGKRLSIEYEIFIGASLLIMLNVLLAIVNGIDLVKLWPNPILPENQDSFSQYLHSGVQMLILSILFAVGIIMFFFRGYFNFFKGAKYLRILGYIWIIQNVILLISTAIRNNMYVEAYGLSHKRIGVFVYLLLAVIGLGITFYKLRLKKNNLFLFRKNAWAFYLLLLIAIPVSWDKIITNYNKTLAQTQNKMVDYAYLAQLSHVNLGEIIPQLDLNPEKMFVSDGLGSDTNYQLNEKLLHFLSNNSHLDWPSTCLSKTKNLRQIEALNTAGKIPAIVVNQAIESFEDIAKLSRLKHLVVSSYTDIEDWSQLSLFPELELLNIEYTYIPIFDSIPPIPSLKYLNVAHNQIYDLESIKNFPNLEHLNLIGNDVKSYAPLFPLKNLKELYIKDLGAAAREELVLQLPDTKIIFTDLENDRISDYENN